MKTNAGEKPEAKANVGEKRRIVRFTMSEIDGIIGGLYNTACLIIHERAPRMTVPMVRAVLERRLGSVDPAAMAALERYLGRDGQ